MPFVVMAKLDESANGEKGFSLNRQGKPLSCSDEGEAEARRKEENVEMNNMQKKTLLGHETSDTSYRSWSAPAIGVGTGASMAGDRRQEQTSTRKRLELSP